MYMQDNTGRDIASNISNLSIDTTGLVKDTTVQATNTILNTIKTSIDNISQPTAHNIDYDNTSSGLTATNVQDAIDEVVTIFTPVIQDHNISTDNAVSVANDTYVTIDDFILDTGTYLFFATYIFSANNNGYRYIFLANSATGTGGWYGMTNRVNAVNNQTTTVPISGTVKITTSTHIYIRARQNSGSSLTVYGRIRPVKIS